jgi:hypothetical protein
MGLSWLAVPSWVSEQTAETSLLALQEAQQERLRLMEAQEKALKRARDIDAYARKVTPILRTLGIPS